MNKKIVLGIAAVAMSAVFCTGCGTSAGAGRRTVLGEAKSASDLSYSERTEGLYEIIGGAERFAAEFAVKAYDGGSGNFAVSPVSVYMALALAAECTNGDTQKEILSALGVSYETLQSDFSVFYRSVAAEYYSNADRLSACVVPANSIWVSSGVRTNESRIQTLANDYYCSSYAADFANDNAGANAAVRDYVKKQTRGLIDQSFNLNEETLFALINTLYLKEIWNTYGDPLRFTDDAYGFKQADGTVKETKLLSGYYASGKAYESETFTSFFARTEHGYQLKFLLPKEGYSVGEIFTAENFATVGGEQIYGAWDHENMLHYNTRCLFPEYKAECDLGIAPVLRELGVQALFGECDFSPLTKSAVTVDSVRHVAKLTVDKRGIEGAAVTVLPAAGAPGPGEYEEVYRDFVVDGAFAYVIANPYGTTLFSGVVNRI